MEPQEGSVAQGKPVDVLAAPASPQGKPSASALPDGVGEGLTSSAAASAAEPLLHTAATLGGAKAEEREQAREAVRLLMIYSFGGAAGLALLCLAVNKLFPAVFVELHQMSITPYWIADLSAGECLLLLAFVGINVELLTALPALLVRAYSMTTLTAYAYAFGFCNVFNFTVAALPTSRSTLWIHVFGVSFERAVKMHRIVARSSVLVVLQAHFWLVYVDAGPTHRGRLLTGTAMYGSIAGACFLAMALLALEPIRRRLFEVFYYSHVTLFPVAMVSTALHVPVFRWCLAFPLALWVLDQLNRLRNRFKYSTSDSVLTITPSGLLKLEVPVGGGNGSPGAAGRLASAITGGEYFFIQVRLSLLSLLSISSLSPLYLCSP